MGEPLIMLTTEIKQRINTCRDILVGKLPDPKSQVLQITNALIYKFMDDQDRLAETLGGKASFFVNGLAPYAWHKLFDAKLTNQERADKYVEGLEKLSRAAHLPGLFQEIFKEAYVPFRDGRVITMFITEINKFDYTHSEELGNAYEYLLSIMGSQGDAGQFRTPRHIIEFLVDVVDPQKGETIYDPAAGTAGFLIAAYNHILEENERLTASDRRKLAVNISGIDISPDMAKMARVNLYLHGFTTPNIGEGDTLTDEHLWGQKYDVILANPPFMSPKGGIQPHDKFSIKAKRSEVLFIDYIAEHLKLKGRAGVIVPEGVIFQGGTAYKQLRKMLVENRYLHTVISLPAGIFQPYSGVKTSMLILDRERAKETDEILFLKVEKDGYSLSAQRTKLCSDNGEKSEWCPNHSDLPLALGVAKAWRDGTKREAPLASWVSRSALSSDGDYNLSADRYLKIERISGGYPFVAVEDVIDTITPPGKLKTDEYLATGLYPVIDQSSHAVAGFTNNADLLIRPDAPLVVFGDHTCVAKLVSVPFAQGADGIKILRPKAGVAPEYLYFLLRYRPLASEGYKRHFSHLKRLRIPLPPLDVQQELVAALDRYQKIIDGAQQVVENYRPHIPIDPDWPMVRIDALVAHDKHSLKAGPFGSSLKKEFYVPTGYKVYGQEQVIRNDPTYGDYYIDEAKYRELESCKVAAGDVLISLVGTYGKTLIIPQKYEPGIINPRLLKVTLDREKIMPEFFVAAFAHDSVAAQVKRLSYGGTMDILSLKVLKDLKLPVPPIEVQQRIIQDIDEEKHLVTTSSKLIERFEVKARTVVDRVWGREASEAPVVDLPEPDNEAAGIVVG